MARMFTNAFAQVFRRRTVAPHMQLDLVDRSDCPALMNLTSLTDDPDLHNYIRAQVRHLISDFRDDSIFPGSEHQSCSCSSTGTTHRRLARKIKANKSGWQDELAQNLLPYVVPHLSASIIRNVHEALAVNEPLQWREFAPCDVRQNRNNPSFVLEATGQAIHARLMLQKDALQQCAIMGGFLNVIKRHWLGCEWFRAGHKGRFPEHQFMRHDLFLEALMTYVEQPTQETFESSASALRWSLAALSCPLKFEHPEIHHTVGTAVEQLEDDKASQPSQDTEIEFVGEKKGVCDFPGCKAGTSSRGWDAES